MVYNEVLSVQLLIAFVASEAFDVEVVGSVENVSSENWVVAFLAGSVSCDVFATFTAKLVHNDVVVAFA